MIFSVLLKQVESSPSQVKDDRYLKCWVLVDTKDEAVLVNNDVEDDKDVEHFDCGRDDDDENVDLVASRPSSGEVRVFTQFFGNFHSVFFVICTQSFFVIFTRSFFVIFTRSCHFKV